MNKKQSDVLGFKINCINYSMCPICYGCRNYNSMDEDCQICLTEGEGEKRNFNVCNTDLHKTELINKMITKEKINITEDK